MAATGHPMAAAAAVLVPSGKSPNTDADTKSGGSFDHPTNRIGHDEGYNSQFSSRQKYVRRRIDRGLVFP